MRSGNLGITWSSMEPEQYLDLSNKGYLVETMRVPFVEVSDVPDIVMKTEGNTVFVEWGGKIQNFSQTCANINLIQHFVSAILYINFNNFDFFV